MVERAVAHHGTAVRRQIRRWQATLHKGEASGQVPFLSQATLSQLKHRGGAVQANHRSAWIGPGQTKADVPGTAAQIQNSPP